MENFKGSTVLLSHHQLFSIHDRLCGSLSKYNQFSCLNPLLSSQLFEYAPYVSGWYWGHEHAFMLFQNDFLGVSKCRLLGNSSFHVVFDKEDPYKRKEGFPLIPFVEEDGKYYQKYLPVSDSPKKGRDSTGANYYNLTYGVISFDSFPQSGNALIEYFCSPSYSEEDKASFPVYKLYEEMLESKANIVKKKFNPIDTNKSLLFLKCEIGLILGMREKRLSLTLHHGECAKLGIRKYGGHEGPVLYDSDRICLSVCSLQTELCSLVRTDGSSLSLTSDHNQECLWIIRKKYVMHESSHEILEMNSFTL